MRRLVGTLAVLFAVGAALPVALCGVLVSSHGRASIMSADGAPGLVFEGVAGRWQAFGMVAGVALLLVLSRQRRDLPRRLGLLGLCGWSLLWLWIGFCWWRAADDPLAGVVLALLVLSLAVTLARAVLRYSPAP